MQQRRKNGRDGCEMCDSVLARGKINLISVIYKFAQIFFLTVLYERRNVWFGV